MLDILISYIKSYEQIIKENKEAFMPEHIKREKSNSITHLVKIVAKEVFDDRKDALVSDILNDLNPQFRRIDTRLTRQESIHPHKTSEHAGPFYTYTSSDRTRFDWSANEDDSLEREVRDSLQEIARNHKRTIGAIKSRIVQKRLCL